MSESFPRIQFPIHRKKKKMYGDRLSNSNEIGNINFEDIILAAFNRAKELIIDLSMSPLLKKMQCC